jgi:hypothetical protein
MRIAQEALTFDDVLLRPKRSDVEPDEAGRARDEDRRHRAAVGRRR